MRLLLTGVGAMRAPRYINTLAMFLCAAEASACDRGEDRAASPNDAGSTYVAPPIEEPALDPARPPPLPVGHDAFRMWDRWPRLRIGVRTYMRSTFDRHGFNRAADAAHYIRKRPDAYVPLDVAGYGVLAFVRTNHWHGSPWHYGVDGKDTIVSESSTANPDMPVVGSTFLPAEAFPQPLAFTWSTTKGADLSWVPVGFTSSFELGYERAFYGTGYYIFHLYDRSAPLSQPITAWKADAPPGEVLELLRHAGEDIAPKGIDIEERSAHGVVGDLRGARTIRALRLIAPRDRALDLGRARLRITFDDRAEPSVDAPISLFFGAGTLFNRDDREYLVKSLPSSIRYTGGDVELSTYFPMPFKSRAKIEVLTDFDVRVHVRSESTSAPHQALFHATYRDHETPELGRDLVLLDTSKVEGASEWCGNFVGTAFQFSDRGDLRTLEGDPRFFFDDSSTPQAMGTGTEEWGGGGDYWGGQTMTLPFAGHPTGAPSPASAKSSEDLIESAYRFLLSDLMPFGRNARIHLEHGGENQSQEHYKTVAFWYGVPRACLIKTDAIQLGDPADEAKHRFVAPGASPPEPVESRYEWGPDQLGTTVIYPATTDVGRHTAGTSELTLTIDPNNFGVVLRRKLDQSFVDQRAEVFIAEDRDGAEFVSAGIWYHAGSNTAVYGWTSGSTETVNGPPEVVTSNRRFRDDEFIVPRTLTMGRSTLRVRIVPTGTPKPLMPEMSVKPAEWSAFNYSAYVWKLPMSP